MIRRSITRSQFMLVGFLVFLHRNPVVGGYFLVLDTAYHLVAGTYAYAVSHESTDLMEQAFKSRPVRSLDHATPTRTADSTSIWAEDTPRSPLLFEYNKCADPGVTMSTPYDWELPDLATAKAMFGASIRRTLLKNNSMQTAQNDQDGTKKTNPSPSVLGKAVEYGDSAGKQLFGTNSFIQPGTLSGSLKSKRKSQERDSKRLTCCAWERYTAASADYPRPPPITDVN